MISMIVNVGLLSSAWALPALIENRARPILASRVICTPRAGGSASTDDVPAIQSAIASCGHGGSILIPSGSTYYLNSVLSFAGCFGCDFQLEGTLKITSDTNYWSGKSSQIVVNNITGAKIHSLTGSGLIDANGQDAWDLFATNSSYRRPTTMTVSGGADNIISNIKMQNPPNVFYSLGGGAENTQLTGLELTAISKTKNPPKNTDGFDIGSSTYTTMTDITVINDDDCIAFKPGANYVTVNTISCTGSHGISVGSLGGGSGSTDVVKNIYVYGAKMTNSTKAAGIKTYPDSSGHGTSTVSNVTFANFAVQACQYAIQIQSCYNEEASTCASHSNANLTGIIFRNFSGSTTEIPTAMLDCGAQGICGVTVKDYAVKGSNGGSEVLCANTPSNLGVNCTSGASG